ncbi:MAG: tetratricopeptide repeat protein [Flavobacteriales bacterium]
MKRSPLLAIGMGIVLALLIYTSAVKPSRKVKNVQLTLTEQIAQALSDIQNGESPEAQMKGVLKMRALAESNPENADLQSQMGMFSMQTGQYEKAVARFEKVISLDENRVNAYMQLAQSYSALQDTSNAKTVLLTLIEKSEGELQMSAKVMLEELN